MARTGPVKLVATVSSETAVTLTKVMVDQDIDIAEAIRRVTAVASMMYSERAAGRKVMTMNPDGSDQAEIVIF